MAFDIGLVYVPFELIGMELSFFFLKIVDFLLLLGAPEPTLSKAGLIKEPLHALRDDEVFPQGTDIRPALDLREVADNIAFRVSSRGTIVS